MKSDKVGDNYALAWAKRIRAIKLLGGKCSKCNKDDFFVLEFHHLYGKDNIINKMKGARWSELVNEIKKCILLCANCHSEIHYKKGRASCLKDEMLSNLLIDPKCKRCGYAGDNLKSLCFHHRIDKDKEFDISNALSRRINNCSLQDIIDEIKKCDVLCRNCHTIEHIDKNKFKKMETEINNKTEKHEELYRLDYNEIKKLKAEGLNISEIAKKMNKGKSSIHYAFHKIK